MANKRKKSILSNQHKSMFEFWGLPEPKPIDNYCHVFFDSDAFFRQGQNVIDRLEADRLYKEEGHKPSTLQGLGAEQALQRERRITTLINGIKSGEIKTVEDAVLKLDGIRTENSVITYLKESGHMLLYKKTGEMVGSETPLKNRRNSSSTRFKESEYKYYDGDPLIDGREISKSDYQELKQNALNDLRKSLGLEIK